MKPLLLACLALLCVREACAQVDEIKRASSGNSRSGKSVTSYSESNNDTHSSGIFFDLFFGSIINGHSNKLSADRERYPSMVSLDIMLQGAVKPASYYILQPRIRANWGLFSTDFRMSYLIEDDVEGLKHIRTNDWQVLQLNLITSRFLTLRVGTGFMQEAFGDNRYFSETAVMLHVHAPDQSKLLGFEFRFAKDFESGLNPRREFNVHYQHQVFEASVLHGYISLGGLYQRYYNHIDVWGVQAGLVFRIF